MALTQYGETLVNMTIGYLPKLVLAIIVFLVGLKIAGWVANLTDKGMKKKGLEATLRKFLKSFLSISLKIVLIITVISMLGVQTTSFIALIGAAGLAVGLALQGSLSNFAGGVLIAIFKPYVVGDVIEAQGYKGKVNELSIFNTILKTPDNQTIIIPNGQLSNGSIVNFSSESTRRVDMVFGIGYDDDIKTAEKILKEIVESHTKVMKDPAPFIKLSELADSSVNFAVRPWAKGSDYWDVYFDITRDVKLKFDAAGISIPYPQTDVHLHQ